MQLLAEHAVEIACPVDVSFNFACNLDRFGEWFPGVVAIKSANDLEHAVLGKRYLETVSIPLRGKRQVGITVTEAEPNRLLVTEGELPALMPRMEIRFQAINAGSCHVTWRMFSRNTSLIARTVVVPLARGVMRKRAAIGMARLKRRLEADAAQA